MSCSLLLDHTVQLEQLNKCLCTQALSPTSEVEASIQSQTKMGNTCFTEYHSIISQSDTKSSEAQRTALTTLLTFSEGEINHISLNLSMSPRGWYLSCQKAHKTHYHGSAGA